MKKDNNDNDENNSNKLVDMPIIIPFLSLRQKRNIAMTAEVTLRMYYSHCEERKEQQQLKSHLKKINKYQEMCNQKKMESEATRILERLVEPDEFLAQEEEVLLVDEDNFDKKKQKADMQNSFFAGIGYDIYNDHLVTDLTSTQNEDNGNIVDILTPKSENVEGEKKCNASTLLDDEITMNELVNMIVQSDQNAAPGVDGMPNVFLKAACGAKGVTNDTDEDLDDNNETSILGEYDELSSPGNNEDLMTTMQHMISRTKKVQLWITIMVN